MYVYIYIYTRVDMVLILYPDSLFFSGIWNMILMALWIPCGQVMSGFVATSVGSLMALQVPFRRVVRLWNGITLNVFHSVSQFQMVSLKAFLMYSWSCLGGVSRYIIVCLYAYIHLLRLQGGWPSIDYLPAHCIKFMNQKYWTILVLTTIPACVPSVLKTL